MLSNFSRFPTKENSALVVYKHIARSFHQSKPTTRTVARNRLSTLFSPLEVPFGNDVVTLSHQYLIFAGLVKQHAAGIYAFTPLGTKILSKISKIICEELDAVGAQRATLPTLMTSDLWKKTGRWDTAGHELFRLKDRKDHSLLLGPTHEEAVCELATTQPISRQKLPLMLYQLDRKFRDEARPRFGLMRGREFWMKDLYTFDKTNDDAVKTYNLICKVYGNIFDRLGLKYTMAEADTGNIGGHKSHEFHIVSSIGEDTLLVCDSCENAMNVEKAVGVVLPFKESSGSSSASSSDNSIDSFIEKHQLTLCDENNNFISAKGKIKQSVLTAKYIETKPTASGKSTPAVETIVVLYRSDRKINHVKLERLLKCSELIETNSSSVAANNVLNGFDAMINTRIVVDKLINMKEPSSSSILNADVDLVSTTDFCSHCWGKSSSSSSSSSPQLLKAKRGIEVGHAFLLGEKYSLPMSVTYLDATGTKVTTKMGCYGLGVTRIMAALVENQLHDVAKYINSSESLLSNTTTTTTTTITTSSANNKRQSLKVSSPEHFSYMRWPQDVAPFTVYIGIYTMRKKTSSGEQQQQQPQQQSTEEKEREREILWNRVSGIVHDELVSKNICSAQDIIIDDRLDPKVNKERLNFANYLGVPVLVVFNEEKLLSLASSGGNNESSNFDSIGNAEIELFVRTTGGENIHPQKFVFPLHQLVTKLQTLAPPVDVQYI